MHLVLSSNTLFPGGAGVQHLEAAGGDEDQWEVCQTDGHAGELIETTLFSATFIILTLNHKRYFFPIHYQIIGTL